MEYSIENKMCLDLETDFLKIFNMEDYKSWKKRGIIKTANRGGRSNKVLIEFESIQNVGNRNLKQIIIDALGNPYDIVNKNNFESLITSDPKAFNFFNEYVLEDGRVLPEKTRTEYYYNAIIYNAISAMIHGKNSKRAMLGIKKANIWPQIRSEVAELDTKRYPHSLVTSARLQENHAKYVKNGYEAIISGKFLNKNSKKVTDKLESLIMTIYCMQNLPFCDWVVPYYEDFMNYKIEIADKTTGEIFNPKDYLDDNGNIITISTSTVWNYINRADNKLIINKYRMSAIDFNTTKMPYNMRHKPHYSMSKVSFDDRALPRKSVDGLWVSPYYACDVHSGCIIGASFGVKKDHNLVREMFIDMYKTIERYSLVWPAEAEVENHLMKEIEHKLRNMFQFVHFCKPQNSREKRAEHIIKGKKYGDEKKHQNNIGRWSNRSPLYQTNPDYKEDLTVEEIIADDKASILRYNHEKHPDFPDKTRWQVLIEHQNPDLFQPIKRVIFKELGLKRKSTIRNYDFIKLLNATYDIVDKRIMERLIPNNNEIEAYWLEDNDGNVPSVYLWQQDEFLCQANKIITYNEAQCERTAEDEENRLLQEKKQSVLRKSIKENTKVSRVEIIKNNFDYAEVEAEIIPPVPEKQFEDFTTSFTDAKSKAWDF